MKEQPGEVVDVLSKLVPISAAEDGTVCMLCGLAGAGKTTAAKILEGRGFVRLSIDEWIWRNHGRFGVDYASSSYEDLQLKAEASLRRELVELMGRGLPVVIDFSFWQRSRRLAYQKLIDEAGRPRILLYLKTSKPVLLGRLQKRRTRFDADAAFPIDEELLDRYIAGFEEPFGEGEQVIEAISGED